MSEKISSEAALGMTSRWTAAARGLESARSDAIFHDPWAEALAGEAGAEWLVTRPPGSVAPMIIRTRYFDDFLLRVTAAPGLRQVVLLAAGLDTRAYRLPWPPGVQLYELDQPEVLDHKAQVLETLGAKPACARQAIGADLTRPWAEPLVESAFNPQAPAAWLLEGFLFYLPAENILHILREVTDLAAAQSWLGFDIINHEVLTSPYTKAWVEMQAASGAPWIGALDDPLGVLASLGWQASFTQAGAPEAHFGRWALPVYPAGMPGMPHNWYVTAQKG